MSARENALLLVVGMSMSMACAGRSRGTSAPLTPSSETVAPVSMALLGGSEGFVPGNDSVDRLLDSPEVAEAGQRLLNRLGSDPQLQPLYEGFTSRLSTHPALMKTLSALIEQRESPDEDPLTLAVTRLSSALDGPEFDAALDQSLDRLFERPDVDAAFERVAEALVEQARFGDRIGELLMAWRPELEAAIGVPMDHEDFPARLQAHVEQPDRNRALHELLGARLVADPSVREGFAAVLDDEAFFVACAALVTSLFRSPDFERPWTIPTFKPSCSMCWWARRPAPPRELIGLRVVPNGVSGLEFHCRAIGSGTDSEAESWYQEQPWLESNTG